jgi:hypothetical protein
MGINVQLRRENREVLGEVFDDDMVLARATSAQFGSTRLLKYLVPWGDTVFNQAQAADLADDIRVVCERQAGSTLSVRLVEVQRLFDQLSSETHLYLWFVGD